MRVTGDAFRTLALRRTDEFRGRIYLADTPSEGTLAKFLSIDCKQVDSHPIIANDDANFCKNIYP